MRTAEFLYDLPAERIAQVPAERRDGSRLLVFHRADGRIEHRAFPDLIEYLRPGDLVVLNDSRVIPARLRGHKDQAGGQIEILLLEENTPNDWWAMLRPGKRVRPGTRLRFVRAYPDPPGDALPTGLELAARVVAKNVEGHCRLCFEGPGDVRDRLEAFGEVPLPPYIARPGLPTGLDRERYQTVFARSPGSVAAPTAGLHLTPEMLDRFRARGVDTVSLTLHVGVGTFAPVKTERIEDHVMHAETFELSSETARRLNEARRSGRRLVAIGTTTVRVLESLASTAPGSEPAFRPTRDRTRIFIHPPFEFRAVNALVTNFHLPASTLLMLVCAFASPGSLAGRERVLSAYREAVRERYRFFSYGDAMLLL